MSKMYSSHPSIAVILGTKSVYCKRFCLLTLLLLMAALPMKAAPVSVDSARTVAANVLGTTQLVNRTAEMPPAFQSAMYLFVPESGVGFALISADDCALPVLGYSTTSVIELSYMTGRYVSYWYRHYANQIDAIRDSNIAASPEVATQWEQWMNGTPAGAGTAIAPMLTTRWDIAPDYQQLTPVTAEGVQCKVPAAGVAMGQVMKYWNHPERGTGVVAYSNNGTLLTAEFDTAYPWSDMPDALDASSTAAQRDAINLLLYHAGVAMRTTYGAGVSSPSNAYMSTRSALTSYFRYSPLTISTLMMTPNNESTWKARVMQDLNSSRPVIYILQTNFSFVVDGCDAGGRLHFNFGLGGKNDGYFTVGSINPGNFTYAGSGQYIVSGIRPCDVYTISVEANNDEWGSVMGSGTYWEGSRVDLQATPRFGSRFLQWSDGITTNPRTVTATSDQTYTAVFEYIGTADIQAVPNNAAWGSVSGGGVYEVGDNVVLTATHTFGSRFRQWNDGNTDNPRSVTATSDQTYTAVFEYIGTADIQVVPNNAAWGSVSGGGLYEVGDNVVLTATPDLGSRFRQWSDGNTDNPRTVTAVSDQTYTAVFEYVGMVDIRVVSSNTALGSASGGGVVLVGVNVELRATPVSGWVFDHWDDGNNDNPRTVVATENRTYTAYFARPGAGDPQFHLVELDDRENHSWSYYSDPECLIRSLNPMDVRIRYFGYGENTMYSSDALQPEGEPDVDVSHYMVGIGIDAPWKNTYVYHKTLERVNGEQAESAAAADGPSLYKLIPNPYSRRPTHGTGDTRWRGFYKWRLKSVNGGSVYKDTAMTQPVTVGTMLDAEDIVFFMPAAEYGMEVDFEAIWARAVVFPNINGFYDTPAGEYVVGSNAYERNIIVHNCDTCFWGRDYTPPAREYTFTFVHPDGTNGITPALLTEVPSYNISGDRVVHFKNGLTTSSCSNVSPAGFNTPPSEGKLNFNADGSHPVNLWSGLFSWFGETAKLEYVRFSPHQTEVGHFFIHRDCAIPETDTTWKAELTTASLRPYFGDTVRGFKVYNGDTLYAMRTAKVGLNHFNESIGGGYFICGRMCLPEDGCDFFLEQQRAIAGITNSEIRRYPRDGYQIRWRLESGDFFSSLTPPVGGRNDAREVYFMAQAAQQLRGKVTLDVVIGSDYDRSLGDNSKLRIRSAKTGRGIAIADSIGNHNTRMFNYVFKSGTFTHKYDGNASNDDPYVMYFGPFSPQGYHGATTVTFEGGEFSGIAGGADNINSVNYLDSVNVVLTKRRFYFKGGHVKYAVWGAADYGGAGGGRRMVFTGGKYSGWIAGGTNGTQQRGGGTLAGDVNIYFGGTAKLQHDTVDDAPYYHSHGGNLYGAGVGRPDASNYGWVYTSHIVVADSAYISRNVYGGGNYGFVSGFSANRRSSDIQILGGTVMGSVFGGANRAQGAKVDITMRGGHVHGSIYGGSNMRGIVKGPVTVRIEGGTVGTPGCDDSVGNVFGSGYGVQSSVLDDVQVIIGRPDARRPHVNNPLIHGEVYGGGFDAPYNSTGKTFSVTTWNGRIKKSVFGGGFGSSAFITGNTHVSVMGSTHVEGNVYGGGNMGMVTGDTRVVIGEDMTQYTLTVSSNNDAMGTVSGGGVYWVNMDVCIRATPAAGHRFKQWNDGNTQNPRTVTVIRDDSYTAQFEVTPIYTITVAVADGHTSMGTVSGSGSYLADLTVSISATPSTGYRFLQWNDGNTQNPRPLTVVGNATYTAQFEEIPVTWVDLGLPSELLWAASNLGADNPEEYGDYYAWGETTTKRWFSWANYIHCKGLGTANYLLATKYCNVADYGFEGYTDTLTRLLPEDDAATVILGGGARIPTAAEWKELNDNTTQANDTLNGVAGRRFTSRVNGNSIFIPFAGAYQESTLSSGSACLWSASLYTNPSYAYRVSITSTSYSAGNAMRYIGQSIRAVRRKN